ncbi:spore germination protein [Paenibacillus sp. KQZ6P-2]|uniref:Spore germination protein n=1 Tax=Paenibacillus mangrovi TaxID=2931978 RepID=A0A9X1WRZ5_9BACL|nr:spore germination protein [Paenibacillus mangrovi]MCJ8012850.1 spore germination protein [Paenibacillus mangrovi]
MGKSKLGSGKSAGALPSGTALGLPSPPWEKLPIQKSLDQNIQTIKTIFKDCSDMVYRNLEIAPDITALVVYVEGIVFTTELETRIVEPIIEAYVRMMNADPEERIEASELVPLENTRISLSQVRSANEWVDVVEGILNASVAVFVDGLSDVRLFNIKGGIRRSVQEPETEAVIRGPREGFTETLRVNTALVRFKIKTPNLKMYSMVLGTNTKTDVVVSYIEGLADPKIVEDVINRLKDIKIDGILESGYIEELIEDHPYSPFPQMQYTERPDSVAAQLLEGRCAIFVDGTPFVLVVPVTFFQLTQASEDYYERFFITNFIRWIRYIFLFIGMFLPSLYIAVTTFHQDMLPTTLVLSIASAREAIPFPALVEALIMEISFEALREAGIRLPKAVGQAVSILGALVIGQAAVQAGIVSAPMVIIVSMTGIASFTIPHYNLAITIRLLRFPLMLLAGVLGLFGIILGTTWILVHVTKLTSLGVPYMSGISPFHSSDRKDIFVRAPWWKMGTRPSWLSRNNQEREKPEINGRPDSNKVW